MKNKKIIITGGSGFIGKRFAKRLSKENQVIIVDKRENNLENVNTKKIDLSKNETYTFFEEADLVIHLAGFSDVKESVKNTRITYEDNLMSTITVLENMLEFNVKDIIYTSTSTIYGEDVPLPTKESESKNPISDYGASKLAGENIIKVKSHLNELNYNIYRLGNIIGGGGHGVVQDFVRKLKENKDSLKILGNGLQRKSYLYVEDCINAILTSYNEKQNKTYNVSSEDTISVNEIADIVSEKMDINPDYNYTGGEKGWSGDVPEMRLDITKVKEETSWTPSYDSKDSVEKTVEEIL